MTSESIGVNKFQREKVLIYPHLMKQVHPSAKGCTRRINEVQLGCPCMDIWLVVDVWCQSAHLTPPIAVVATCTMLVKQCNLM